MKVLVANRGEIACRILRTLKEMAVPSVAVFTEPDENAPHVHLADEALPLGKADRYLSPDALVDAARRSGATAVHPGYGFLSQSAAFVRACEAAGLIFIGPGAESMEMLGDKRASRAAATRLGIPLVPGAQEADVLAAAKESAEKLGYPVLLKAAGGGGGRGMRLVRGRDELPEAHEAARREAKASFADDRLILEKYISPARHVEVQILGNGRDVVALGERECSLQRRYQKVIEEAPAARISAETRRAMGEAAARLGREARYRSAGTVEFLVAADGSFYFLEVNTRLQVEHPVTELISGMDLVKAQVEIAQGGALPEPVAPRGHAIEARLNAEDPYRGFLPQSGPILMLHWPQRPGVRIDSGIQEGQEVSSNYDSLLAKIIAWGADRESARRRLVETLREITLLGIRTNQSFLLQLLESDEFRKGDTFTTTLEAREWPEPPLPEEILSAARRWISSRPAPQNGAVSAPTPWESLGGFRVGL
ncbi:MAG TPA: biotin carboxylase N-terminal domain-containing protein [Planctomycetota bacterium]|jgi:acetyl/propionyl-CoA carboxylase alpha subunit|nr:biotin carboxylase N-terminal domain-containing protein [Planctomycetota bacterium]